MLNHKVISFISLIGSWRDLTQNINLLFFSSVSLLKGGKGVFTVEFHESFMN